MISSPLARPAVTEHEASGADTAICRNHQGLILALGDKEGSVFFCPIGRQYWRYTTQVSAFNAPLRYPKSGVM